jgi:AcrR family transcriptional regulator
MPARRTPSTSERILASAERLFAERGFAAVSMPAIGEASGITAGAIYKHFDSKADLFFEVVRRAVQATPVPPAAGAPTGAASLPDVVAGYTTRRLKRLRQLAVEVHYAAAKDAKVRRLLRESVDHRVQGIRDLIATEGAEGTDPELLAWAVMVFIMGLMHMETLAPHLIDDARFHDLVRRRLPGLATRRDQE